MKRIRLSKPQATLVHPNDSDLQFVVERPPAADIIQFQDEIQAVRPAADCSGP